MLQNGLLYAAAASVSAWLMYEVAKVQAQASGNRRGLQQFKKILANNVWFKRARASLLLHPLAGFFVGFAEGFWLSVALGLYFVLLAVFGVLFLIGSFAVDTYGKRPRER
jgi:hypothetical protein